MAHSGGNFLQTLGDDCLGAFEEQIMHFAQYGFLVADVLKVGVVRKVECAYFAFDVFVPLIVISSQNLEVNVVCNNMIAVAEAVTPKTFSDYFLKNLEKGLSSDFIFFANSEHEYP